MHMRFSDYLKDKIGIFLLQAMCMLFLSVYLLAVGNTASTVILVIFSWCVILVIYFGVQYYDRRKYFKEAERLLENLEEPYLLAEMIKPSWRLEDKIYQEILRKSNKAVIEKIHHLEEEQREYKEYIESWIHEAKTPVTAMNLICENMLEDIREQEKGFCLKENYAGIEKNDGQLKKTVRSQRHAVRRLQMELAKMENQVEKVLYYARMERAYQDYFIVKTNLREVALRAIQKNKMYLMENQMQVRLDMEDIEVSTDEKWVLFLLNQILSNCIKYRRSAGIFREETRAGQNSNDADECESPAEISNCIRIYTERQKNALSLVIEDNGCGIRPEEIGRIFQKGFCGSNNRKNESSTGIGLYLCKRLCDKLEIGICAQSEWGTFTRMILTFPDSGFAKL